MTRQWQDLMMDGWGKMTKQVVGSDSFAAASSAYLDWALSWQKQMRNNTGQFLDSLEFPKRSDVARISKQVMAVEMRIADMEDRLDKMTGLMSAMSEAMQRIVEHSVTTAQAQTTPAPSAKREAQTQAEAPTQARAEAPARPAAPSKPQPAKKPSPVKAAKPVQKKPKGPPARPKG
jgi:TolA-binding protein